MSDNPEDKRLKLRHLLTAVEDVAEPSKWYELGLELQLTEATLDNIRADPDHTSHKRMMLQKWLQQDPDASWEKLASALTKMGYKAAANRIRQQFMNSPRSTSPSIEEDERCKAMAQVNFDKVRAQFSSLLVDVREAMQSVQVSVENVRHYLVSLFERGDCIPSTTKLLDIFEAVSIARLWRFDNYGPLESVASKFLPTDSSTLQQIRDYKAQLSHFKCTTKIIDYISLQPSDLDCEESVQSTPVVSPSHLRELKTKLKLKRRITDLTLKYIDDVWQSIIDEFDLPPLTVVIQKITSGCLEIDWLVLPSVANKVLSAPPEAEKFYSHHHFILVAIDGKAVYYDRQMVKKMMFESCTKASDDDQSVNISYLLELGIDPNIFDEDGYTLLFRASSAGNLNVVECLLKYKVDVNQQNKNNKGSTALIAACHYGHLETVKVLLKNGAIVNHHSKLGYSPIWHACMNGHSEIIKELLLYDVNLNQPNDNEWGNTPLIAACQWGHAETAKILLHKGAIVDYKNKKGQSALWCASCCGCTESVEVILKFEARVNEPNLLDSDSTPLITASYHGYPKTVEALLYRGAIIDYQDKERKTALHYAVSQGHVSVVKLLLLSRAQRDIQDKDGYTPLFEACLSMQVEIAVLLLSAGAIADIQTSEGVTCLMLAAKLGSTGILRALLKANAGSNITDKNGRSALFYAAEEGHELIVVELMNSGAMMDIKDKDGLGVYDVASINSQQHVCDILEQCNSKDKEVGNVPVSEEHTAIDDSKSQQKSTKSPGKKHDVILDLFKRKKKKKKDQISKDNRLSSVRVSQGESREDNEPKVSIMEKLGLRGDVNREQRDII